jgi:CubicO group peptidase (beta-lactamase class C family)
MSGTRRDFLKLTGLAAASVCSGCAGSNQGGAWTGDDLDGIRAAAGRNGARGWAVWQGNRQLFSWNPGVRGPALSMTKSLASLAATRAVAGGWLALSEHVADTITEWRGDSMKSRITVEMLLQQTSGLEAGVIPLYRNHPADKGRSAISLKCVDSPGTVFRYGPAHWEILAELMKRKLPQKYRSLADFMRREVMNPIGLSSDNWRADGLGTPYFSTGTELSVNELGHLGRTIGRLLAGHDSHGFSAAIFAAATHPSSVNPMFGGGLWRNRNASLPVAVPIEVERSIDNPLPSSFWSRACLSKFQPARMVALIGSGGRRVYIWPDEGKRIARLGSSDSWSDISFLLNIGMRQRP